MGLFSFYLVLDGVDLDAAVADGCDILHNLLFVCDKKRDELYKVEKEKRIRVFTKDTHTHTHTHKKKS